MRLLAICMLVALSACRRDAASRGTCSGAIGPATVAGPLSERSAYEMNWSDPQAPTLLKLDCSGRLVLYVELKATPRSELGRWAVPAEGTAAPAPQLEWELSAPRDRPKVTGGVLEAALDDLGTLKGKARLELEDASTAGLDFALVPGHFSADLPHEVDVSAIPGRISFKRE